MIRHHTTSSSRVPPPTRPPGPDDDRRSRPHQRTWRQALRRAVQQARRRAGVLGSLMFRVGGAVFTLWLLSVIVFTAGQWLPGDVGRAVLGPLADAQAVAALDHRLGVDQPIWIQYGHWLAGLLRGDLGSSYTYKSAVAPFIADALGKSIKLGALAFVIVVPLGILGGVLAALRKGQWLDRLLSVTGVAATVLPEFISSIVLILIFGIWLRWLPVSASAPPGTSAFGELRYLLMPAIPLVLIFFGYIARITRIGMIDALAADYTRTAVLKGLPMHTVIVRHVLRNALLPTVTVATTQLGYLIGGLVVVETIFHYQGIGSLIFNAAQTRDFPMLEAGVLTIGLVYTLANLAADALHHVLNPRLRQRGGA